MRYIGVDLAWGEGTDEKPANETGIVSIDEQGTVHEALWARGVDEVAGHVLALAEPGAVIAIDAPLVITNDTGNRVCESEVTRCYGRWQVSANPSNLAMAWKAGVVLRERLEEAGLTYLDGTGPARPDSRSFFECYPFTTLVGMWELGYDTERPRYKRLAKDLPGPEARAARAAACDDLLHRMAALAVAETPLDLRSHPVTAQLLDELSPVEQGPYKHREDLLDAALCAWTAAIWQQRGAVRTQVLGAGADVDEAGRRPTIVAPARDEQRLSAARGRGRQPRADATATGPSMDSVLAALKEVRAQHEAVSRQLTTLERDLRTLRRTR